MVDDFYGNAAGLRLGEGARGVAVERGPSLFVDLGFQCGLKRAIRIVCAKKVGVPDEETLFVVVGVDEPAGDAVGAVAADFTSARVKDVYTVNLHLNLTVFGRKNVDVRLAKDDEEIALAGVLEILGHVQIGIHSSLEDAD